jgi:hypothetical protein
VIRTTILVKQPEGFYGMPASFSRAETWKVTVTEVHKPWGRDFEVLGTFVAEHIPRTYDVATGEWIEPHDVTIPGLVVPASGPYCFKSLGQARKRARWLADGLDGRMFPVWQETSS